MSLNNFVGWGLQMLHDLPMHKSPASQISIIHFSCFAYSYPFDGLKCCLVLGDFGVFIVKSFEFLALWIIFTPIAGFRFYLN